VETPPPLPPKTPLAKLSRWPLILMQVFLFICALGLLALACAVAAEYDGGWKVSLIVLLFASLAVFGLRKAYRLERELAKLQAAPTDAELSQAIAGIWNRPEQRDLPPEEAWLAARPKMQLVALAGLIIFLWAGLPLLYAGINEYRLHFYGQSWKRSIALGCFALYGAWVFFELYRCSAKLRPGNVQLDEAMEHYRRFHNYGAIFAIGIAWAIFCSFLM
jgi:hypothetical protein